MPQQGPRHGSARVREEPAQHHAGFRAEPRARREPAGFQRYLDSGDLGDHGSSPYLAHGIGLAADTEFDDDPEAALDGTQLRYDGVHFRRAAVRGLASWLLPRLLAPPPAGAGPRPGGNGDR